MAGSNFQDAVVLNGDTLAFKGEAHAIGTGAGAKSLIVSNDVGAIHYAATPTAGTVTVGLPTVAGTLALKGDVPALSAAGASASNGTIVLSNSNGISFGMNGSTITASYTQSTAPAGIAAGASTETNGTVVFGNLNGLSFGFNGSTITGSYTVPSTAGLLSAINISAGTTSTNASAFTYANANGVSFGLNGQTVTASVAAGATATGNFGALAAGTQTATSGTVAFANSNGISFGMSGSTQITASYTVPSTAGLISAVNFSAGTTSSNATALTLSNSNNVSFGLNGATITASASYSQSTAPAAIAAGGSTATNGTVVLSNSNGISFGFNGSTITASYTVPTTAGLISAVGFSAGTTNTTATGVSFVNGNNISFGINGNTITASVNAGGGTGNFGALAAGTQTATSGTVAFSNSNGVTFGMSGSNQITASIDGIKSISAGTTRATNGEIVFSNSNGVSFGLNGNTITATVTPGAAAGIGAVAAGTQTQTSGTLAFVNSNGLTFGMSNSSQITGSYSQSTAPAALSFPGAGANTVFTAGTVSFGDVGSYGQWTTAAGSIGLNPFWKVSAGTTSNYVQQVTFGNANNLSFGLATGAGGLGTITVSYQDLDVAIAAGASTVTSGTVVFSNSNGVSFGYNGSTITASIDPAFGGLAVPGSTITSGTVVFSNSNGVVFGINGNTITASVSGLSTYAPWGPFANSGTGAVSLNSNTSAGQTMIPFVLQEPVYAEALRMVMSMSFVTGGTSSYNQSGTLAWGIYTRPAGASSTQLNVLTSSSLSYAVSYNNSSISVSQVSTTNFGANDYSYVNTNSAGLNISSQYTGLKMLWLKVNNTLTPGQYWLGIFHRNSSSSFNSGIRISLYGNTQTITGVAPMGSLSTAYSTGTNIYDGMGGNLQLGGGSYTVAAMTTLRGTVSMSQITQNVGFYPYAEFVTRGT